MLKSDPIFGIFGLISRHKEFAPTIILLLRPFSRNPCHPHKWNEDVPYYQFHRITFPVIVRPRHSRFKAMALSILTSDAGWGLELIASFEGNRTLFCHDN